MKISKRDLAFALLAVFALICGAFLLGSKLTPNDVDKFEGVDILDETYYFQIDEIYSAPENFKDKKIRFSGVYYEVVAEDIEEDFQFVMRFAPVYASEFGDAGFEVNYFGEPPKHWDYVEVIGTLEFYTVEGEEFLRVKADSVRKLDIRGHEHYMVSTQDLEHLYHEYGIEHDHVEEVS